MFGGTRQCYHRNLCQSRTSCTGHTGLHDVRAARGGAAAHPASSRAIRQHAGICTWRPNTWYRALGAKIGKGTSISIKVGLSDWDSIEIGDGCLLGGSTTVNTSEKDPNTGDTVIKGVRIENGVTSGVDALFGAGCLIGTKTLVGVHSQVQAGAHIQSNSFVMGSRVGRRIDRADSVSTNTEVEVFSK